jgi:photosystem II stability/assembly factor-like uncharacterized protein
LVVSIGMTHKFLLLLVVFFVTLPAVGIDKKWTQSFEYRFIGPTRGGRATAVQGVPGKPTMYYMGTSGGGVWKTVDAGVSWVNISDGFFTETQGIGSLAIATTNPEIIYVGTGESNLRSYVPEGVGIYKSTDGGNTWKHKGLRGIGQISRVVVHPTNPDWVYVGVLGLPYASNSQRGLYLSKDGGNTWRKVFAVNEYAGVIDIALDPRQPENVFVAFYQIIRPGPWLMESGGPHSGLYRSRDAGRSFEKVIHGLPTGSLGRIGVTVSPADSKVVYTYLEATNDASGIYRSNDGGKTFTLMNNDRVYTARHFFFGRIFADIVDPQTVYIGNIDFHRSTDGGKTFSKVQSLHVDHHDMWINPENSHNWIQANDGGAAITFNNGKTYSSLMNQATAELYNVTTDHQFPYRVLGAQHDNSTISVNSRPIVGRLGSTNLNPDTEVGVADAYPVAGGEQGEIRAHPLNPALVYSGDYQGLLFEYQHENRQERNIEVYPQLGEGTAPSVLKHRFRVQSPLRVSPHDPNVLYHASQYVNRSRDRGTSWTQISPDLSRNDKSKQIASGGIISKDNIGTEIYGSIKALEESPHVVGELWAGTDDGRLHVTRDGGRKWQDITPSDLPAWSTINSLELSVHRPGRAIISAIRNGLGDFAPYVWLTNDYGKSWQFLTAPEKGIPNGHFVRVVREDHRRSDTLYAGTEIAMYFSLDGGDHWHPLQLNLPVAQVADLAIKNDDLVVATYGRSFWILDDISPFSQLHDAVNKPIFLFEPRVAYRPNDTKIYFSFDQVPQGLVTIEIRDQRGDLIHRFCGTRAPAKEGCRDFEPQTGINRLNWDLRYPPANTVAGAIWFGENMGPFVVPGKFQLKLQANGYTLQRELQVMPHPKSTATPADYQAQFQLAREVLDKLNRISDAVRWIRATREQLLRRNPRLQSVLDELTQVEGQLMQIKSRTPLDTANYPTVLDGHYIKALNVITSADAAPTQGVRQRLQDLETEFVTLMDAVSKLAHKISN